MAIMAPPVPEVEDSLRLPMPSRNPLPLSAAQEAQVRELYHTRVRNYCSTEIKGSRFGISRNFLMLKHSVAFAECALGRTFSAPFVCRKQRLQMNTCMISHATQEEQDAAREEWFAT